MIHFRKRIGTDILKKAITLPKVIPRTRAKKTCITTLMLLPRHLFTFVSNFALYCYDVAMLYDGAL